MSLNPTKDLTGKAPTVAVESVSAANPAANAEFSFTVPANEKWLLVGVSVQLVQGITQTPWPSLIIDDGTNVLWEAYSGTAVQGASTTAQHTWAVGATPVSAGTTPNIFATGGLPMGIVLPAGYRIRSNTIGIGANSNYGVPRAMVVKL